MKIVISYVCAVLMVAAFHSDLALAQIDENENNPATLQAEWCCIPSAQLSYRIRVGKRVQFAVVIPPESGQPQGICHWYEMMWQFDATTSEGKNMLSTLLAAKLSGKPINVDYYRSPVPGTDENSGCTERTLARAFAITIADY